MKNSTVGRGNDSRPRRRRKGTARLFVLGATVVASAVCPTPAVEAAAATPQGQSPDGAQGRPQDGPRREPQRGDRDNRGDRGDRDSRGDRGNRGDRRAEATAPHRFDIEEGYLSDLLPAFQQMSGMTVTLSADSIGTIHSDGVVGDFTVQDALSKLLAGTPVSARMSGPREALLVLDGHNDSVRVVGTATVQSTKYPTPLRDVAQTIAVIPRTIFESQGATTLSETLRNVPGITLQAGEGGGASSTSGDMFNMRGFNASNSLFVDGVRDDGLISRDVFNLEQVEVFMGPTGSDVGRGTAAGYVNMQTKTPHLEAAQSGILTVGTAGQKRASADFNVPLSGSRRNTWLSKSALRLNVLAQNSGVAGRDVVELENMAIAPSLALGIGTSTRASFSAQIVRQDNIPDYGIPGAAWTDSKLAPTTVFAPGEVRQENFYGNSDLDYDKASQDSITARVEHDLNNRFSLRNQTRYNKTHREAVVSAVQSVASYNAATNLVTVARQGNERENGIVSNQTNLTGRFSTGRLRHAPSLGLGITSEQQFAPTLTGFGTSTPVDIFSPTRNPVVTGANVTRTAAASDGESTTVAVYAFDTVELNDRVQLSGGIRWEHYKTNFRSVDAAGLVTADLEGQDGLFSGKAGVLFRINQNGNVYVSYGSSVTPPGSANFSLSAQATNQNNPSIDPQVSKNYEVGTKWGLANGRLSLSTAVFRTDNTNVIFVVDSTAIPPLFNQNDGQRVDGVTAGIMGRISDRWDILANIGYLDATVRSQNAANNLKQLTLTPEWSSSIWSTYRLPVGLTVGGGVRNTTSVFINTGNTIQMPGYKIIDALLEYTVNSHLSLRANINNLANERYIRSVNNNGGRYNPGNTRSAIVTSNIRF